MRVRAVEIEWDGKQKEFHEIAVDRVRRPVWMVASGEREEEEEEEEDGSRDRRARGQLGSLVAWLETSLIC